jgi:gliding motility-associated-like protein
MFAPALSYCQLKANFTANNTSGCSPLVVNFSDVSTGNPTSWKWEFGDGSSSTETNPAIIYIKPGNYSVKLIIKSSSGTDSTVKNQLITVHATPTVDFSADPLQGCGPLHVNFTSNSTTNPGTISSVVWDFGDGTISKEINPKHVFNGAEVFNITLTAFNNFGCKQSTTKEGYIKLPPAVSADFDYTYVDLCQAPAQVTFNNLSQSGSNLSHTWKFGDGTSSSATSPSHSYTKTGNYSVQLISTTENGCTDTSTQVISIGIVKPDFTVLDSVCIGSAMTFKSTSNPVPQNVLWSFGDGTSDTGLVTSHIFSAAGSYTVTFEADFGACNGSIKKTVTLSPKPKASFDFTGNVASCLLPLKVSFNNTSTGAVSYKWLFGDSTSSSLKNPVHSYLKAGNFTPSLVVYNSNGCSDSLVSQVSIKSGPPVLSNFVGIPKVGCVPLQVPFAAIFSSPVAITRYLWDFGDNTTSNLEAPLHVYTKPGSYDIKLTVSTAEGCDTTFIYPAAVVAGTRPTALFAAHPLKSCASFAIAFSDSSTKDVNSWEWHFGDGGSSAEQNPQYTYRDTGYFDVTLIVKNNSCPDTLVLNKYVEIYPPVAKMKISLICSDPRNRTFTDKSIGAKTWFWDFGDGSTSKLKNPVHRYADTGRYMILLKVSNGTCEDVIIDSVAILKGNPVLNYQTRAICRNQPIVLKVSNYSPRNYKSIAWNYGNGDSANLAADYVENRYQYSKTGSYIPVIVAKDINGCLDTASKKVNIVVYGPTAGFSNLPGVCFGSALQFNDSSISDGIHNIVSKEWRFGDNNTENATGNLVSHTYAATGTYDVVLKIKDEYGCADSLLRPKAVNVTKPVANFSSPDTLICSTTSVRFNNKSLVFNATSLWNFGDNTTSNLPNPTHQYVNEGTFTVTLLIKDVYGCTDSLKKTGYIKISNPHAEFSLADSIGQCPPLLASPVNKSSHYKSLSWVFGDGSSSVSDTPHHYYNIPGTYKLNLIVKGYGNCADTASKRVLLKGPWGVLNYTKLKGCVPTEVSFSSTSVNVASYIWDYNNGVVKNSLDTATKYTYTSAGSYLPKLVLIDSAGCKVSIENKNRIVISGVNAAFNLANDNTLYCDSVLKKFKNQTKVYYDSVKNFTWNFGDNKTSAAIDNNHYYSKNGNYDVKLSVVTGNGCTDSITVPLNILINQSPEFVAKVNDSVCEKSVVKFIATNTGVDTTIKWKWNFGDNTFSSSGITEHVYTKGGSFTSKIEATTSAGCTTGKSIPVFIKLAPLVDAGPDTVICYGNSYMLKAQGALLYSWRSDNTLNCLDCSQPVAKPAKSTFYYTTGYNAAGCSSTDSVFIKVAQPVRVSTTLNRVVCTGQTPTLTVTGADNVSWQPAQYLENPNAATTKFSGTASGEYKYLVIGKDKYDCFSDSARVVVKVYPIPTIEMTNKTVVANVGIPVKLETKSSADVTRWQWTPSVGLNNPTLPEPTLTAKSNATYTVTVANDGNCTASEQLTVDVLCDGRNLFIPNTFSPNNDGMNDRFFPHGKGVFNIKSLRIFNRWGQVVFEKSNFDVNNPEQGWDGKFQNKEQVMDVYVYMMEVVCENGYVNKINGNVTLLR